jgi:hypothetical protein
LLEVPQDISLNRTLQSLRAADSAELGPNPICEMAMATIVAPPELA